MHPWCTIGNICYDPLHMGIGHEDRGHEGVGHNGVTFLKGWPRGGNQTFKQIN